MAACATSGSDWIVASDGSWCTLEALRRVVPKSISDPVEVAQQPTHGEVRTRLEESAMYVGSGGTGWQVDHGMSQVTVTVLYRATKGYVGSDSFLLHNKGSSEDPSFVYDEQINLNVIAP